MTQRFSDAVNAEQAFVRQLLHEFAGSHPKVANRLRLGVDGSSDPAVSRLVQAFSFLMARTRRRIDDRFPEILNSLVALRDPAAAMAIPSLASVEFVISPDQAPDADGTVIPRGTELESKVVGGVACRFRTCAGVELWPIELTAASLVFPPFSDSEPSVAGAGCALRLSLRTLASNVSFDQLAADRLRFFIRADLREAFRIHQLLFAGLLDVAVRPGDGRPKWLGRGALHQGGFDPDEPLLPVSSGDGERQVAEFFCFPEKFLYFELRGLRGAFGGCSGTSIDVDVFLGATGDPPTRQIDAGAILLNCVPAVNLFSMATTPVEVKEPTDRVTLEADRRYPAAYRIHSVDRVSIRDEDTGEAGLPRFHTLPHPSGESAGMLWELDTLELSAVPTGAGAVDIRFVDAQFESRKTGPCIVNASATCSNADLPQQLGDLDEAVELQPQSLASVSTCRCLAPPTRVRRFALQHTAWDRVAEVLPDDQTLSGDEGAAALRAALRLFVCDDDPLLPGLIESIVGVELRRPSGIVAGRMVCHGVEMQLTFRRSPQQPDGHLLFARVLRDFLSRSATQGTFFRLRAQYENEGEIVQWPMTDGGRFVM